MPSLIGGKGWEVISQQQNAGPSSVLCLDKFLVERSKLTVNPDGIFLDYHFRYLLNKKLVDDVDSSK